MADQSVTIYIDYKSPYAYLSVEPTWALARDFKVNLKWLPYTLDIPDFLGSAKVDNQGKVFKTNLNSSHVHSVERWFSICMV